MGHRIPLIFSLFLTTTIYISNGCQMEGVIQWPVPVSVTIYDTHRGNVLRRSTSEIEGINSYNTGDGLNAGPYLEISYSDSQFLMWTNDTFQHYEENEVEESMSMTVNFRCTGGTTRTLVFWISVIDTNNNAPQFLPSNELEFTIATPVPPGFLVTGCFNDITVRDIDLTTQRIDFEIEENPFFEIEYDASLSTTPKEFKALLRTTTLIRTLTEPIILRIRATDVDLTGDPPITTYGTIRVASDTEFQFPEEPVFSQIFYLADYSNNHTLVHEPISLRQGYDEHVQFSLEGDYTDNFQLIRNGNQISITVQTPLNATTLMEQHILLIVTAEREYTSGAATTIVIRLPEVISLEFESPHYYGNILNNNLQLSNLILSQGYQDSVSVTVLSEYGSYFNAVAQGNSITVTMTPLNENIILENSFIYLQVIASTDHSSATSIVTLEIIKDDNVTPVFNKGIYTGNYDPAVGLTVEPIYFVQGFDEHVSVSMFGDHSEYFQIILNGSNINIRSSELPPEIYGEHHLLFSIVATKPRTVGANAAVVIYLPAARVLDFEAPNYKGTLLDNALTIETILLSVGYDDNVNFNLTGDHASFFTLSNTQNQVTLNLLTPLPDNVISENNLLILTLSAFSLNAITTSTNVVLEIIKEDITTPLFNRNIYFGDYIGINNIAIENINLRQGYAEGVSFRIEGEHSQYFGISNTGNNVILSLQSAIPHEVIFNEKVLSFSILAEKALTVGANAAVLIKFPAELTDSTVMRFSRNTYVGTLEDQLLTVESIVLHEGYDSNTQFGLTGDYAQYFAISNTDNLIAVTLINTLPTQVVEDNNFLILEIEAQRESAVSVSTSIVIDIIKQDIIHPVFSEAYYRGVYIEGTGLRFEEEIYLLFGHDDTVNYRLEGEFATLFSLEQNGSVFSLRLNTSLPQNVMEENIQLLFTVVADKLNAISGRSVISIELLKEKSELVILSFAQNSYVGVLQEHILELPFITLVDNNHQSNLTITGEFAPHFAVSQENNIIRIDLIHDLNPEIIEENAFLVLNLIASYDNAISGHTTIIIELAKNPELTIPVFNQPYYIGEYSEQTGLSFNHIIQLSQGNGESVTIALTGDDAQWFRLEQSDLNNYRLIVVDEGIRVENRNHLVFSIVASTPENINIHATVIISLTDYTEGLSLLGFERITYTGSIQNNVATLEPIVLSEGFTSSVSFSMFGDLAQHFILTSVGPTVTIALRGAIPEEAIPANRVIVLEVQASAPQAVPAHTSVVFTVATEDDATPIVELAFTQAYYTGSYSETGGLTFGTPMSLSQGYDESVEFALVGDQAQWFSLVRNQNSVTLIVANAIPAAVISNNNQLIFEATAQGYGDAFARTLVVISLTDTQVESDVRFENVVYEGGIQNNIVRHENIVVLGFTGTNIELHGEYAGMFISSLNEGVVSIEMSAQMNLPHDVVQIVLEMHAATARAVLLLNVISSDAPNIPSVSFSSSSYSLHVDITQTGLVGQVHAIADNGESVRYRILTENSHLLERLSINNAGELHLSAPVNSGVYTLQIVATTIFTQATATATVHLTVETITICGNDLVVPPLIVLDRDEEEPHNNLVVLNTTHHPNCRYILTNRWPTDNSWLYVDENGLHARAIDREHESIAFMALSQVQVELNLHCDTDRIRAKRSTSNRPEWLGPYDYGTSNWILSDSIAYNSRRSFVNLIVNDINDNAPIFMGKENEPIAVGYPIPELEETVMPRSLAELQATDADIGINAALLYWSSESELAVAPSTGFVHVRDGAQLEQDARFIVHATDRNGEGLRGSIELIVKLLDINNILVVTISDAFLDDERTILEELSKAVGYDVRVLRSTITSQSIQSDEIDSSRKRRETGATGASLQLYVYGLIEREPVAVDRLAADLNNNAIIAVSIVSTVSLEDHLEGQEICVIPGRDTGLLVATIILSILLFILIVLIIVWVILRRRKKQNYEQFSDQNSLASKNESLGQLPKPDNTIKPRLNIEDLKKSERRLQEMLDAPLEEVVPHTSRVDGPFESILDMPTTEPHAPIVIQSIDKLKDATDESEDDEFGETNKARRKSVVTFNENVEKIIHVEDDEEPSIHPGYEGTINKQ